MTEPTLPTFANRAPRRTYHRTATAPHQPHRTTRHARSRRRQRLINLGLFLYSCLLIAALVLAAFS
jgi:hypothetical protein